MKLFVQARRARRRSLLFILRISLAPKTVVTQCHEFLTILFFKGKSFYLNETREEARLPSRNGKL